MGCNQSKRKKIIKNSIIINSPTPTIPTTPDINQAYILDAIHPASHIPEINETQKTCEQSFKIADSISPGKFIEMKIVVLCQ